MLRLFALICITLAMTLQQASAQSPHARSAAHCSAAQLTLPNLNALKLTDGEHVVGMLQTELGKLEARVNVKGGEVSDPDYYLRGKHLKEAPNAKVPRSIRACLNSKGASTGGSSWFAKALNLVASPAEAAKRCIARVVGSGCDDTICCAKACCGRACAVWCAYI